MAEDKCGKKMIAVNREVRHEYFVIEALETGIELGRSSQRHEGRDQ